MGEVAGLVLRFQLEEHLPLDGSSGLRHVERWRVSVSLPASVDGAGPGPDDGSGAEIGYAQVLVLNLEPGVDIGDLADPSSGTWVEVEGAGGGDEGGRPDSHVLVLDRVRLRPDHRGGGLGPIVAAASIARLGRGCHLAACYPAPFDAPSLSDDDRQRAIDALGPIWAQVGFRHWRDGVWMLDLVADDIHATLRRLVATRDRGGSPT